VSTKFEYVAGMQEVTAICTGYATKLLQVQVEVAQKVDYEFVYLGDSAVMVKYKDHTHNIDIEAGVRSCSFWNTMLLPCRHIIVTHLHKGLSAVNGSMINQRWLKSIKSNLSQKTPVKMTQFIPAIVHLDMILCQRSTLDQTQKYKKMLNLYQKIATQASMVGMPQFQEMYSTVEMLVQTHLT